MQRVRLWSKTHVREETKYRAFRLDSRRSQVLQSGVLLLQCPQFLIIVTVHAPRELLQPVEHSLFLLFQKVLPLLSSNAGTLLVVARVVNR